MPVWPVTLSCFYGVRLECVDFVDPWGGSYFMEKLTWDIYKKARGHILEIDKMGGMLKAWVCFVFSPIVGLSIVWES